MKHATAKKNAQHSASDSIDVIIKTPKGSRNKIKYDPASRSFKLSKVLPEGMVFPYDFGFVPSTKAEDGDPLDVLVLTDEPLFSGCVVTCTLIGGIEAEQTEEDETHRNDRLIAVADQSLLCSQVRFLDELNANLVKQIEAFFVNYQRVRGIEVTILGHAGPQKARQLLSKTALRAKSA